ncbi:MAG: serine/threonine-protein kinase [Phycisphaerales bacterium]|nr:serine/threonine-protein kinase [Phycisphaerales bacterium]
MSRAHQDWFNNQNILIDLARRADRWSDKTPVIEGYEVLHEMGRGGQGIVFHGIQRSTGRNVAIKVLRNSPFATKSARRRFEREAELIAKMRHPNIVRLYDAGITFDGCAYIVIENLRGSSLAELLRLRADGDDGTDSQGDMTSEPNREIASWSVPRVLQLFAKICDAVRYAHQHGVIHRDLKPANILVVQGGERGPGEKEPLRPFLPRSPDPPVPSSPDPVIVDFGLARTWTDTDSNNEVSDSLTETGRFVGTLAWASPEQACGRTADVDTRSDVYSLGAILYQTLTGRFPCDTGGDFRTAIRNVAEIPPVPPSRIRPDIDDELETIILRCLAKEPARRYQSADAVGTDVERYLAGLPIEAKRDSASYLIRKTIQRHKLAASLIALLMSSLVVSAATLTWLYGRASEAEDRVRQQLAQTREEKARSDAVKEFLKRIFGSTRQDYIHARVRSFPDLLADASHRAGVELAQFPRVEAEVRTTIGGALFCLDRHSAAEDEFRKALAIQQRLLSYDDPALAGTQTALAATLVSRGALAEAQPLLENALATYLHRYGADHPATGNCLLKVGKLMHAQRYHNDAETYCQRALATYQAIYGERSVPVARCLAALGAVRLSRKDYDRAEEDLSRARRILEQLHENEHPLLIRVVCSLAELRLFINNLSEAAKLIHEAHALNDRVFGDGHLQKAKIILVEARLRRQERRLDEAERLYREVLRRTRDRGPPIPPIVPTSFSGLGFTLQKQGKHSAAIASFRKALKIWLELRSDEHPLVAAGLANLAQALMDVEQWGEAEMLLHNALKIRRSIWPEDHEIVLETRDLLARCSDSQNQSKAPSQRGP